ncbi:MAG: hypothetical protein IKE30_05930, partial [Clostridia bacterium]|nr:hypothetical protein [Clostridia bacterium]
LQIFRPRLQGAGKSEKQEWKRHAAAFPFQARVSERKGLEYPQRGDSRPSERSERKGIEISLPKARRFQSKLALASAVPENYTQFPVDKQ